MHFDHAGGNGAFLNTPIIIQRAEYEAAQYREEYLKECILPNLNYKIIEGDYEVVPGVRLLYTPGHSPGSISYYCKEANAVFSGDVLFQMSIGRTDLPGGSFAELIGSIEEKLFVLPDETAVLCGHGPETSIGFEKEK